MASDDIPPSDDGIFNDYPEVDQRSCRLLGPAALIVQALLGILVILSLVYKRNRETPKRPWRIWLFDVAKQLAGQVFVHGMNLLISGVVAHIAAGNACVFYFLNILVDTTLGIGIIYFLLKFFTFTLTERFNFEGFVSGQYGSPPSSMYWIRQTAVYVLCLTLMKLVVVGLFALWPGVFKIGEWLLSWLGTNDVAQVVFVMGLFPILMNIIQFWLIDSIVKANEQPTTLALPPGSIPHDQEPLFRASDSDDEENATISPPKYDVENPQPHLQSLDADDSSFIRKLTPEPKSVSPSGSTTPLEVEHHDVAMHRYRNPSSETGNSLGPTSNSKPSTIEVPVTDDWAWDEEATGQGWEDGGERDRDGHGTEAKAEEINSGLQNSRACVVGS